jgi:hypothetical protein
VRARGKISLVRVTLLRFVCAREAPSFFALLFIYLSLSPFDSSVVGGKFGEDFASVFPQNARVPVGFRVLVTETLNKFSLDPLHTKRKSSERRERERERERCSTLSTRRSW